MGNHHWNSVELNIILQRSQDEPDCWLLKVLSSRSKCAISCKRRRLGIWHKQDWVDEQVRKFHESFQ